VTQTTTRSIPWRTCWTSQLAHQLERANQRVVQAGRPGRLRWTQATVELGVTWEKTGDGGVDLKVVRLGGGITKANTTTITVTVVPSGPWSDVAQGDVARRSPPATHPQTNAL
jgi:hypothetical protein